MTRRNFWNAHLQTSKSRLGLCPSSPWWTPLDTTKTRQRQREHSPKLLRQVFRLIVRRSTCSTFGVFHKMEMSEFNFRIVVVPEREYNKYDEEDLYYDVEHCLYNCDLEILSIDFFEITRSDEAYHPELEELILQISAKGGNSYGPVAHLNYEAFVDRWADQLRRLPCTYLMLYVEDSFANPRVSRTDIQYNTLNFGILPHNGCYHKYASLNAKNSVTFYHDTRNVCIYYGDNFEIRFTYSNIRNVIVNIQKHSSEAELFFDLFSPPVIFRVDCTKQGRSKVRHRNLNMEGKIDVDILGRANVLCLCFTSPTRQQEWLVASIHSQCNGKPIFYSRIKTIDKNKPVDIVDLDFDFNILYLMTALLKKNFVLMTQLCASSNYFAKLVQFSKQNSKALERALTDVLSALEAGKFLNFWHAIKKRYRYCIDAKGIVDFKEHIVPPSCCFTRRITITPTRVLFWPQELIFGNRILRNFDSEFAIRVIFRDDNMGRLSSVAMYADDGFLESCIVRPMIKGIYIGPRYYEFLAWSNSQIRDHGVWMYARDLKGRTSAYIRRWMGDFSHIHNVPKYMARMGQCFSQTEDTFRVALEPLSVRTVPDIEGGCDPENNKPYIFSDGIGRISTELAEKVHEALNHDELCSAFQIRYAGYKGMLAIDPSLKDVQIEFRSSMKKFDCNSVNLEIARTSGPVSLQLNRPFIAILNDLGVRHRVFLRLQEDMLKTITDMLFDEELAYKCLQSNTQSIYPYEDLSKSGIFLTTEPFFRSILLAVHRHQISILKSKANISIDPKFGRNVLGVLDETGILNYGEVFIQYSSDISYGTTMKETEILEGEVLVTKNPCHFPGDVRKFNAIDVPQLHHIVDCIVFPQRGPRPHPSEMSGADLDGDEFAVIWLPELIFESSNRSAAHFPAMKSPDLPCINVIDMVNWLQDYITNDQIGKISHAHLALADKHGIDSVFCTSVAKKVSIAVDFAKTGQVEPLCKDERPKEYPDFMEKEFHEEYKSQKALGKMYRICKDYETENVETSNTYQIVELDDDLKYPGWEKYEDEAIAAQKKYNSVLGSLLRNYGIDNEVDAISGAFNKLHSRYQERNDKMDVMKMVSACVKKLMADTLSDFFEEFIEMEDIEAMDIALRQKASAWYYITYSKPNMNCLSFAWTVSKYLASIKIVRTADKPPPFSPAIMTLDEKIVECEIQNLLPDFSETLIGNEYKVLCDPHIVKRALRVLILWAQDEEIIEAPGHPHKGLLFKNTFIKLFLHVAKKHSYLCFPHEDINTEEKSFSSGKLCVDFLKFCSSLRFYNKNDIHEVLPFTVYKYSKLSKRAVMSYHRFALLGLFRNLYFDRKIEEDVLDMKPIAINSSIFTENPVSEKTLRNAEEALSKYSRVEHIRLSEHLQTKKVWVCAIGSEKAIKELKVILRKKCEILRTLFDTGKMPEDENVQSILMKRRNGNSVQMNSKKTKYRRF